MSKPERDLKPMMRAAKDGDHSAAKALLRLYGFDALATEIKRGNPFAPKVARQIAALTSHIGTEWEADLLRVDLPPRRRTHPGVFEE